MNTFDETEKIAVHLINHSELTAAEAWETAARIVHSQVICDAFRNFPNSLTVAQSLECISDKINEWVNTKL